jgi:alginate O-acetyltransferase complex protein AlgJ
MLPGSGGGAGAVSEAGKTVAGRDGWMFSSADLSTASRSSSTAAATGAIAEYGRLLKSRGIDLIAVPVPVKAAVYPDKISKELKVPVRSKRPPRMDSAVKEALETLESKGVQTVDLLPVLIAERETKSSTAFPRTSSTWAPAGVLAAAKEIAAAVRKSKAGSRAGSTSGIVTEPAVVTFTGPLAPDGAKPESLPAVTVGRISGGKQKSLDFDSTGGGLVLLGGSDLLAWRENSNPPGSKPAFASLAEQLASELQLVPDVISGGGDARNSARLKILRDRSNGRSTLNAAKTVVWVFPAADLFSQNWVRVPLQLEFSESGPEIQLR